MKVVMKFSTTFASSELFKNKKKLSHDWHLIEYFVNTIISIKIASVSDIYIPVSMLFSLLQGISSGLHVTL